MDRYSDSYPPKSRLLDPTNDVVWKLLLTAPHRKHLLLSFVNAVLQLKKPIRDLTVLNPEITREMVVSKGGVLDIIAVTPEGMPVHLEMQSRAEIYHQRRAFYYASKVYTQQLQKGDQYDKLRPGYSINLLHFNHFRDTDPHRFFRILIMMDHKIFREYPDFMTLYSLFKLIFRCFALSEKRC